MPELGSNSLPDTPHDTGGVQQAAPGTEPHIRVLAALFRKTSLHQLEDGDLIIRGVPMLAEGTWTDSAIGTPLFYPAKTLSEFATNWQDKSGWNRHMGGVPRRGTDKVGEAENIRFENGAITADVRVYGFTQNGRDMQEMIKRKLISFVSVEHGGDERLNPSTRQMEASSLVFYGFAFVNRGACQACKLNEAPIKAPQPPVLPAEDTMDTKDLEAQLAAVTKELEAVKAAQKPVEAPKMEIPKELSEMPLVVKALMDRIEKIEKTPAPSVTAPITQDRELGEVETVVVIDKAEKTIRGA